MKIKIMNETNKEKLKFEAWYRGYPSWNMFRRNDPTIANDVKKEIVGILDGQMDLLKKLNDE